MVTLIDKLSKVISVPSMVLSGSDFINMSEISADMAYIRVKKPELLFFAFVVPMTDGIDDESGMIRRNGNI